MTLCNLFRGLVAVLQIFVAASLAQAGSVLPDHSKDQTLGTVNCASSTCHGAITPWKDSNILQNEYVTWSRLDKHARAYTVLLNDRSRRIAKNLRLKQPPEQTRLCLDCHAHNPPPELRGERFNLADGVSCEGCHGPAQRWIKTHTEPNASHARNVDNGLYPTDLPMARAKLCLSCHFGNGDKLVTHRIMGAGHPRISFELDTFGAIEPAHYRVDKDYIERKGAFDGVKLWAVGQALAVAQMMDILADPKRNHDGLFPELVLFDCHACHHPMSDLRWKPKNAFGDSPSPGVGRLNDSNMLMLRAIARGLDQALGKSVSDQIARLHRSAAGEGDVKVEAAATRKMALDMASRIETAKMSEATLRGIALGLVDEGLADNYSDYAAAEQGVMAIGSVVNFMNQQGLLRSVKDVNGGLARLQAALASDEHYQSAEFQRRLKQFRALIAIQ